MSKINNYEKNIWIDKNINEEDERGKRKVLSLSDREEKMLRVIDRLRISKSDDLAWLCGYSDYTYCRKCLRKLEINGYVKAAWDRRGKKCYYLSHRGLIEIGKVNSHEYELSYTTNHALLVGKVCRYIKIVDGIGIDDMITDVMMKTMFKRSEHRPDIIVGNECYEVELNHKKMETWESNILSNERFEKQYWIVPDEKMNIARNLDKAAKTVAADIRIVMMSEIDRVLCDADIHSNKREDMRIELDDSIMEKDIADDGNGLLGKYLSFVESEVEV